MRIRFGTQTLEATPRFLAAVDELARAQAEMLGAALGHAELWATGRVTIGDLSTSQPYSFEFGTVEENLTSSGLDILMVSEAEEVIKNEAPLAQSFADTKQAGRPEAL